MEGLACAISFPAPAAHASEATEKGIYVTAQNSVLAEIHGKPTSDTGAVWPMTPQAFPPMVTNHKLWDGSPLLFVECNL